VNNPLDSSNNGSTFYETSIDEVTSSLTTKVDLYFISFNSFEIGGIDLMAIILPFQLNI